MRWGGNDVNLKAKVFIKQADFNLPFRKDLCDNFVGHASVCQLKNVNSDMIKYLFHRLIGLITLLFGITIITFSVIHLAPGRPTDLEAQFNPKVSLEARERITHLYGLDKPLHVQYGDWLRRFLLLYF